MRLRSLVFTTPRVRPPQALKPQVLTFALVAAAFVVACGEGGDAVTPTSTPPTTATSTPPETPIPTGTAPITAAEDIDFTDPAVIGPIIDHFGGGEIDPSRVQYVDLTRDGNEDAFVIVESGGTAGDVGAALLTVEEGDPQVAGYIETGGRVEVRFPEVGGGIVVTTQGVWAPGDAECCPSNLRESTYEWEDGAFVLQNEQVVDNPDVD